MVKGASSSDYVACNHTYNACVKCRCLKVTSTDVLIVDRKHNEIMCTDFVTLCLPTVYQIGNKSPEDSGYIKQEESEIVSVLSPPLASPRNTAHISSYSTDFLHFSGVSTKHTPHTQTHLTCHPTAQTSSNSQG